MQGQRTWRGWRALLLALGVFASPGAVAQTPLSSPGVAPGDGRDAPPRLPTPGNVGARPAVTDADSGGPPPDATERGPADPGTGKATGNVSGGQTSDAYAPFVPPAAAGDTAPGELTEPIKRDIGSQIFFDARQTSFNQKLNRQVFHGDVVAIGAGTLIAADDVELDRNANLVTAKGHIVVLNHNQLFLGDALTYHLDTSDFQIDHAQMVSNDTAEVARVSRRLFGFTPAELEFEQARQARLADVSSQKDALRREVERRVRAAGGAGRAGDAGGVVSPELIDRYAQLLGEEEQIQGQENPSLAHLPEERRDSFKRRRDFWEQSQKSPLNVAASSSLTNLYLHIDGDVITRVNGNDFTARNALFTPCKCDKDESPAWAFRADEVFAQQGGYADLDHAVLEIKGIPVLYLPYMKIPLKDKRQSGFLMPTISYDQRSGNVVNAPVYFDLSPSSDATVTTDFYENRGTRLGLEYRVQQRQEDGWEMKVEGIRDQLWLQDRGTREVYGDMLRSGLATAGHALVPPPPPSAPLSDRDYAREYVQSVDYWNHLRTLSTEASTNYDPTDKTNSSSGASAARQAIDRFMAVPNNTWRGSYTWRGTSYLAPRLSLVSNGEIDSDHRYLQDLYVPEDFNTVLAGSPTAKAFSTAKYQMNLDGKDYYAGLGGRYGDNFLSNDRFEGQQLPVDFRVQSRLVSLLPDSSPLSVYGQLRAENLRIAEYHSDLGAPQPLPGAPPAYTLGDGNWRRVQLSTVTPLVTDRIVTVSQFTNGETRYIQTMGLDQHNSQIRSWITGLQFHLPIDGYGELPAALQRSDCPPAGAGAGAGAGVGAPGSTTAPGMASLPNATAGAPSPGAAPAGSPAAAGAAGSSLVTCVRPGDPDAPKTYVHHYMDWGLRVYTRPAVVKHGPYTVDPNDATPTANGRNLSYFASDIPPLPGSPPEDSDVPDEERMSLQQRIMLTTHQEWHLLRRAWQRVAGSPAGPAAARTAGKPPEDPKERARRELLYNLTRPVTDADQLYDQTNQKWLVDRYDLADQDLGTPIVFDANVAYDFLDAKERAREKSLNGEADQGTTTRPFKQLIEPWKPVNASLGLTYANWTLAGSTSYDVYAHAATTEGISLIFPAFFSTNLSTGYTLSRNFTFDNNGNASFTSVATTGVDLATSLIPPVTTYVSVHREVGQSVPATYTGQIRTAYGFTYASPSSCWGLQFLRVKDFANLEENASYLLRLSVIFMGQERPLPDVSPGILRESQSERKL